MTDYPRRFQSASMKNMVPRAQIAYHDRTNLAKHVVELHSFVLCCAHFQCFVVVVVVAVAVAVDVRGVSGWSKHKPSALKNMDMKYRPSEKHSNYLSIQRPERFLSIRRGRGMLLQDTVHFPSRHVKVDMCDMAPKNKHVPPVNVLRQSSECKRSVRWATEIGPNRG